MTWGFTRRILAGPAAALVVGPLLLCAPASAQSYDASTVANLTFQMNQLQEQMRQLAGQVQQTSHQIQLLQEQMRRLQEDSEFRFQQLEKGSGRSGSLQPRGQGSTAGKPSQGEPLVTGSVEPSARSEGARALPGLPSYGAEGGLDQLASAVLQDETLDPAAAPTRVAQAGGEYAGGSYQRAQGPQILGTIPADPSEARAGTFQGQPGSQPYGNSHGGGAYGGGGPVDLTSGMQGGYGGAPSSYDGQSSPQYGQPGLDSGPPSLIPEAVERAPIGSAEIAPPASSEGPAAQASAPQSAPSSSPSSGEQVAALTTVGGGPDKLYEQAYDRYASKQYSEAEREFKTFLERYAENELAGNARYWLGESYFAQGNYKQAATEFLKGYQLHKKGPKAPDSLIGLAKTLGELGQKDQACAAFDQVSRAFPSKKDAIKRATQESKKAGCI